MKLERYMRSLASDESGQTTIEWVLVVGTFVMPIFWAAWHYLVPAVGIHYGFLTFFETLPFP